MSFTVTLFVWLWIVFFFAGNFFFHLAIHVSSLTVTLLCSQGFCLRYQVPQSVSHYAICNTCVSKKKSTPLSSLLIFWTQPQRFLRGIKNQLVKPTCFVKWCKRMKNLSRVFPRQTFKKKKNRFEETWGDWVLKFNSRLSFYYRLPAVEKCL